MFVDIRKVFIS